MKSVAFLRLTLMSCVAVALTQTSRAEACGGGFHRAHQGPPPVGAGPRMALSISAEHTVLWDQVQYVGDPKDFAWVLPVGPGAVIETANDAWFEALEAVTATRIMSPIVVCNGSAIQSSEGGGVGCAGNLSG